MGNNKNHRVKNRDNRPTGHRLKILFSTHTEVVPINRVVHRCNNGRTSQGLTIVQASENDQVRLERKQKMIVFAQEVTMKGTNNMDKKTEK